MAMLLIKLTMWTLNDYPDPSYDDSELWVAQIVGFYVDKAKYIEDRWRVDLRWLYRADDLHEQVRKDRYARTVLN